MKNFLLLMMFAGCGVTAIAQTPQTQQRVLTEQMIQSHKGVAPKALPDGFNPLQMDMRLSRATIENLVKQNKTANKNTTSKRLETLKNQAKRQVRRAGEAIDTVQCYSVAQSYFSGYSFTSAGGDVLAYNIGVAVDGTKVTFSNFFNLYDPTAYSPAHDYPFTGTYDPEKKTITVPTKSNFADATICGDFYGYYPAVLMAGTIGDDKKLQPDDELVFHVEGDFERITTDQAVCAFMFTADGSQSYGVQEAYKQLYIQQPTDKPYIVTLGNELNFGNTFVNYPVSKTFYLANLGGAETDYAIETESDDDSYSVDPVAGTIKAQSLQTIDVTLENAKAGDYDGISTIEWDGGDEPYMMEYTGTVTDYPDYSKAIKGGDMKLTTELDYPFEPTQLEDGTNVAASTTHGYGGASSKLYVNFEVPEGKLGKFSWKGVSNNSSQWNYNAGGAFVDNQAFSAFTGANEDMSNFVELAPGKHEVRFQYDSYYYSGLDENRLYVYDLDFSLSDLAKDAAELKTTSLDLGSFLTSAEEPATGTGNIEIVNKGENPLKITKATTDNSVFTTEIAQDNVATMKTATVYVDLNTDKAGTYNGNVTLETNAGTYTVPVKALVRDMPDFQSIVKEGEFTFTTDGQRPWLVENGVAYNSTAKQLDYTGNSCEFTAKFTVPEGKIGILSWDGDINCNAPEDVNNWYSADFGQIGIQHPMSGGQHDVPGGVRKADSETVYGSDENWAKFLQCVPGEHSITFKFIQIGDTLYAGDDCMRIKDLSLKLMDFEENNAELVDTEAKFDSTFVGYNRYTTATVKLKNLGSEPLEVLDIPQAGAFYGIVPTDKAQFGNTLDVTLWFYPTAPGEYKDNLTIKTSAGDFTVACEGFAKDDDGYLLIGDFEDDAYGWSAYDADKDGEGWNLGYNLFGGDFPEYCHSGKQILGSASYSYNNGDITPDNWTISPLVSVPEEGAMLTWYAAPQSKNRPEEHYSVYVATEDMIENPENLNNLEPVFSETLNADNVDKWSYQTIDLKPYAGEDVCILFRHHDCTGQWLLKLDDVFVWTMDKWGNTTGVKTAITDGNSKVSSQELFDVAGRRINTPQKGVNIIRTTYADGTVKTTKFIKK